MKQLFSDVVQHLKCKILTLKEENPIYGEFLPRGTFQTVVQNSGTQIVHSIILCWADKTDIWIWGCCGSWNMQGRLLDGREIQEKGPEICQRLFLNVWLNTKLYSTEKTPPQGVAVKQLPRNWNLHRDFWKSQKAEGYLSSHQPEWIKLTEQGIQLSSQEDHTLEVEYI